MKIATLRALHVGKPLAEPLSIAHVKGAPRLGFHKKPAIRLHLGARPLRSASFIRRPTI